ncbi:PREDICTED: uncharacterized protein LOC104610892 [Nelumbo nucifera]|uniref:Uncharacterized protein LOC104610892 n=2 Tax=Nelumbo nucifera TaxID=4432 RepID=A0A1U8B524_NELNU|nr:PREDICTED: uncharacterized protein LOC104610892 [Nelumbo nucifera]XP_010276032.1 PREDICTED: uncharacterized protein LOC104610892 [Nelumbo nucifera]XP_010276033.1 PREDICTED: uncharacterized protein LOC104610892 [Nelumbo nucifera]XP_010276034.1 PREDICTED: uncharacterized protein LOC104610892 [Nelumbo nucifera]DAD20536.1 TPA_asm: hypothetical protein HUJ06_021999 [Nelumbo nucifera]
MVQTLEAIKGGGGSVRIGATGTISSLMTRELDSIKRTQTLMPSRRNPSMVPVSVPCGVATPKKLQPRRNSTSEASTSCSSGSSSSNKTNYRSTGNTQKTRHNVGKNVHRIPMLSSDDITVDRTPNRGKPDKKAPYIVEVVDIKCGNPDKAWSTPITNRLKKLNFSKLSETIA